MTPRAYAVLGGLVVVLALIAGLLWYRGEAIKADNDRDKWQSAATTYADANRVNVATIERYKAAETSNAAIAADMAAELDRLKARGVSIRTEVREAYRNDPQANDWANAVVPRNVRDAATGRSDPVQR